VAGIGGGRVSAISGVGPVWPYADHLEAHGRAKEISSSLEWGERYGDVNVIVLQDSSSIMT
jgi:hypothetical protein